MDRGIQLACEQCDFAAALYERLPFAVDAAGQPQAVSPGSAQPAVGYWSDALCGECRLPVRTAHWLGAAPDGTVASSACPRCGAEPIPFADALRELAEACHSRAWLDLSGERTARERVTGVVAAADALAAGIERGDLTTTEALESLSQQLSRAAETPEHAHAAVMATNTLVGLPALVENAASVEAAVATMAERLRQTAGYVSALESCVEDESFLPGVPCPRCSTGHLVHWPLWL
jgi:hypothetical protein